MCNNVLEKVQNPPKNVLVLHLIFLVSTLLAALRVFCDVNGKNRGQNSFIVAESAVGFSALK